jgi:NAD-dependent dihydropyrimidine dehydrogenase PreA subunit
MVESIDEAKCTACGTCEEICPLDVYRLDLAAGHSTIRYGADCQTCFQCELECPAGAIRVGPFTKKKVQVW